MPNIIDFPVVKCDFCKKRVASKLCDKPKGERRYAGHPPENKGPIEELITCDAMICDKCVTHITGMDLCPKCLKEIKDFLGS